MKILSRTVAAVLLTLSSTAAFAQTCGSPIALTDNANVTGDTCTASNTLGTLCLFSSSPGNDIVYSFAVNSAGGSGYTATSLALTNNTPGWNAGMVLITGTCSGNSACPANADANGAGGNESLNIGGLSNGTYFAVVTAGGGTSGCGSYSLAVNGTLPVELQDFTIN